MCFMYVSMTLHICMYIHICSKYQKSIHSTHWYVLKIIENMFRQTPGCEYLYCHTIYNSKKVEATPVSID